MRWRRVNRVGAHEKCSSCFPRSETTLHQKSIIAMILSHQRDQLTHVPCTKGYKPQEANSYVFTLGALKPALPPRSLDE
jgi:hypothetical protein